jgi:hypothetical protein
MALARTSPSSIDSALASPAAPAVFGGLTALLARYVAGSLAPAGIVSDEWAYRLQATLLARGHWSAAAPPIPAFFSQMHVLVEPVLAGKYLPGLPLLLAVGVRFGAPFLVPLVMAGVWGALVFAIARRVVTPRIALGTWLLWLTSVPTLNLLGSYMSEPTSGALLWGAGALTWAGVGAPTSRTATRYLAGAALLLGYDATIRPLTALAVALVLVGAVLRASYAHGVRPRFPQYAAVAAAGLAPLLLIPLQAWATLGSWRTVPLAVYTRTVMPYDRIGFGLGGPPALNLPPDQATLGASFAALHAHHTLAALPLLLGQRLMAAAGAAWSVWPLLGLLLAAGGARRCWRADGPRRALACCAAVPFLAYALYAHPQVWTVYYAEIAPLWSLLLLVGLASSVRRIGAQIEAHSAAVGGVRQRHIWAVASDAVRWSSALGLALVVLSQAHTSRWIAGASRLPYARLAHALATLPVQQPAIVFVRYSAHHNPNQPLVISTEPSESALTWLVYDRGDDNARLLAVAPDRHPYLYDEASGSLRPLVLPVPSRARQTAVVRSTP